MSQGPEPKESGVPTPSVPAPVIAEASFAEPVTGDPELEALGAQMLQLEAQGRNGASWFYWVAALSLVNSVISLFGGDRQFLFGLGVTQVSDAIGLVVAQKNPETAAVVKGVAFGFALAIGAAMVLFGWLANKRLTPVFALGMALYLLDGLLLLAFQNMISVAFHGFVLYQMWQGLSAYRQLSGILTSSPAIA